MPAILYMLHMHGTGEEYLVVFSIVQNLVGIGYVVLKVGECHCYTSLALKCLFTLILWEFWV